MNSQMIKNQEMVFEILFPGLRYTKNDYGVFLV